jgi:para-aminobenzoate synthetase component 1
VKQYQFKKPFLEPALSFAEKYSCFMLLDNTYDGAADSFHYLLGAGCLEKISSWNKREIDAFLENAKAENKYVFCQLNYNLKNRFEKLESTNADLFEWPEVNFFIPQKVLFQKNDLLTIYCYDDTDSDDIYNDLINLSNVSIKQEPREYKFNSISKEEYIKNFNIIKHHISRGDIYEINYCFPFTAE